MNELTSEANASVQPILERITEATQAAFWTGAMLGDRAFRQDRKIRTVDDWRRAALLRYESPSWKRSMAEFVPRARFTAAEIYNGRRDELAARHPGHNNLNVGTHNALEALIGDGFIVRVAEGRYAPAIDGVALPEEADSVAQSYQPLHQVDSTYARLLGYAAWTWAILEWDITYLIDVLQPKYVNDSRDRESETVAADFAAIVQRPFACPRDVSDQLSGLAQRYADLVRKRHAMRFARPCTLDGRPTLTYNGSARPAGLASINWTETAIMEAAKEFEVASIEANRLRERLRGLELKDEDDAARALSLAGLQDANPRVVAATAKTAIEKALIPLIALGRIPSMYGAEAFTHALSQAGILGAEESVAILNLTKQIATAAFGDESTSLKTKGAVIEELWRLARSPGIVCRAIAKRARSAGKVTILHPRPLPGDTNPRTPVLTVDGTTISIATAPVGNWGDMEVVVDVDSRAGIRPSEAPFVVTYGSRVLGTDRAIELVPWLVDDPLAL